jgi:chaperonin GroEL
MAHKHLSLQRRRPQPLQRRRPQQSSTRREPDRGCGPRDTVGAPTESDLKRRKDAFDDASSATKAAVADGIVPGGGVALLRAMDAVMAEEAKAEGDERTGLRVLRQALTEPARQIASNSGIDLGVALEKIRSLTENVNMGLDTATGRYVDLVLAGIIDPTKVVRVGLENAVSVAGVLLLTEATMTELPEPKSASAAEATME